ncbi:type 1 periplasmic binding fold superfamily protein [Flavobacterium cyanobacteriorum]|uniref:Type 1 periplasmic binding fold superfamily protein n=1 Tax=Flavobacterium cyanobacteriorum TaxID=2022802 RepID=A0A255ZWD1_9FLAO|nr:type 1 periplasmic binding fold superfamily protein [Flavobacterium cyanobacteriorum]OYQ45215.1 type 1 periplasmic binding fold superfamily protein [Flavobacterium cyanobacteriorum]
MKKVKIMLLMFSSIAFLPSCSDDDTPRVVNEEEVITTVTATFTPAGGGAPIVLTSKDLDDDGPGAPTVTVSGNFTTGVVYNGSVTFLNELQSPAGNITEEIEEEGTEHQLFFIRNGNIGSFAYADSDTDNKPIGLAFTYTAASAPATGTLTIALRHELNKNAQGVAQGDITNAGGSTDAQVTFPVSVTAP